MAAPPPSAPGPFAAVRRILLRPLFLPVRSESSGFLRPRRMQLVGVAVFSLLVAAFYVVIGPYLGSNVAGNIVLAAFSFSVRTHPPPTLGRRAAFSFAVRSHHPDSMLTGFHSTPGRGGSGALHLVHGSGPHRPDARQEAEAAAAAAGAGRGRGRGEAAEAALRIHPVAVCAAGAPAYGGAGDQPVGAPELPRAVEHQRAARPHAALRVHQPERHRHAVRHWARHLVLPRL
jgi:hypothetical protein